MMSAVSVRGVLLVIQRHVGTRHRDPGALRLGGSLLSLEPLCLGLLVDGQGLVQPGYHVVTGIREA